MKNILINIYLKLVIILLMIISISATACSGTKPVDTTDIIASARDVGEADKDTQKYADFNTSSSFGLNNGASSFTVGTGGVDYMRFQNTAGTGILNNLEIKFNQIEAQGMVRMGVYSDNNNSIGDLLLDGGQVACGTGWVSIDGLGLPVESGRFYWMAFSLSAANTVEQQKGEIAGSHYWFDAGLVFGKLPEKGIITAGDTNPYIMRASVRVSELSLTLSNSMIQVSSTNITGNWLSNWAERMKLTLDRTKVSSTLVNFPVLVRLSTASGITNTDVSDIFNALGSNSKKVAITTDDGTTQCYVEIESWDNASRQAYLWVKVPVLSNTADTILYLYYDANQADNMAMVGDTGSAAAQNVWDSNYVMVQHFAQNANGTIGEFVDSSKHNNNGTGGGGNGNISGIPKMTDTVIGKGQSFDGVDDYIQVNDSDDLSINTSGHLTLSVWVSPAVLNFTGLKQYISWMGKGAPGKAEWQLVMYNHDGLGNDGKNRSQWISFYVCSPPGGAGAGGGGSAGYISPNDWVFFTATTDMNGSYGFFNGTRSRSYDLWSYYNIRYQNGSDPLRIGTDYLEVADWWNGRMDEIRISNVSRSDAWISTDYYSESDKLINFGNVKNRAPTINPVENKVVEEGHLLSFTVLATDPDYDTIIYSASNLPSGAVFDSANGIFSWTPGVGQAGIYEVHLEAGDGSLKDFKDLTITVAKTGTPTVSKSTPAIEVGVPLYIYIILGLVFAAILATVFLVLYRRR